MKRLIVFALLGFAAMSANPANAQVSVNINIGAQPDWGPRGYNHVDYYYLPEVESYYYVPTRQFIYHDRGRWIHARNLPHRYRNYNLHKGRKVVMNSHKPYLKHQHYKTRYSNHYASKRSYKVVNRNHYDNRNNNRYSQKSKSHYRKHDNGNHGDKKQNHGNNGRR